MKKDDLFFAGRWMIIYSFAATTGNVLVHISGRNMKDKGYILQI